MLQSLLNKVKQADSRTWRWILGVTIGIVLLFAIWYFKRQANKIARLEAEKMLATERAKDLELQALNEKNGSMAQALREEAEKLRNEAHASDKELADLKKQVGEAQKAVQDAKTWKELERQARG